MEKLKTYVINIKSSIDRKEYMVNLIGGVSCLHTEFVEAVDGRLFTDEERMQRFDDDLCLKRYGRLLNLGEIGCTLSHFKCYNKLQESSDKYVLILEDDISIIRDLTTIDFSQLDRFMNVDEPRILFLSGDYWHLKRINYTRVFSAVGSYAYIINKAAVGVILSAIKTPSNVADDWHVYKQLGVRLYAMYPYMIDANITDMPSSIRQEYWGNHKDQMSYKYLVKTYYNGIIKKILVCLNLFESKRR